MIIDTISHQPIEEPILTEINPPYRPSRPNPLPAIRLWLALRRLSSILATMAASHPQTSPTHHNSPSLSISPRIRHPIPSNQAAYYGWLPQAYKHVFRCEQALTGPIISVEAPAVEGLSIYGARNSQTRFYGAWIRRSGKFVGWMRTRPNLAGEAPDDIHATGEVLGRPVFTQEESKSCALHDALESFWRALMEAAMDIG
jgi:hypothetical protein